MSMSVMKKVALGVPVLMVLAQAPMTHLPSGTGISPLQVIARFLLDARDKPAEQRPSDWLVEAAKCLLLPANAVYVKLNATENLPLDVDDIFARGLEIATAGTGTMSSLKHAELLLAGSWCFLMGSLLSLVRGRIHMLQFIGVGMTLASILENRMTPSLDYLVGLFVVFSLSRPRRGTDEEDKEEDKEEAPTKETADRKAEAITKGKEQDKGSAKGKNKGKKKDKSHKAE